MGKTYDGVHRTTFLIDKEGNLAKIFEKVKPDEDAGVLLETIRELSK
jgi:peroxiredoxin Q/BCP